MKKIFKRAAVAVAVLGLLLVGNAQEASADPRDNAWIECFIVVGPTPCDDKPAVTGSGGNHMCQIQGVQGGNWGFCLWSLELD